MKLTVEINFEDCLKACLDYAERKMRLFSEIIGKKGSVSNSVSGLSPQTS